MKNTSVFRRNILCAAGCLLVQAAVFPAARADAIPQEQIQQNKADEQDVRVHTAAVVTQIQGLIDELAANGISGSDIKVLESTKAALSNLSGPEMDRVIASLQKAGHAATTTASQQSAVSAYADQKGIILEFRQILKDYEERQAAYDLPVRFKDLTDRQTETMLTSIDVARATAGKSASELTAMQQTTQEIAQADQEAITNEVALAQEQLAHAAQGSTGDEAQALQHAQNDLKNGQLTQALNKANAALKSGHLLEAISAQKTARDELRHIDQDLNPPATAADALATDAATLAKLIDEQQKLLAQTNAAVGVKPRITGLDTRQGALVDEASTLQQDMQTLSATPAGIVKDAIGSMQTSRAQLAIPSRDPFALAATSQQDAIAKLLEAQKQLQQQVAAAQQAAQDAAKDPMAQLQNLQKQIQTAQQQQQQVSAQTQQAQNNPTAPNAAAALSQAQQQQAQLQQQAAALQQSAQPVSLQATQALATAAQQMNQAQQDLADPAKAADAQAAQQAAQAALAQANQQVAQQISQSQQQTADPAAIAAAAAALQKAQNSVSDAIAQTPPPAATPPAGTPPATPPPSTAAAGTPPGTPPPAGTPPGTPPPATAAAGTPPGTPPAGTPPGNTPPPAPTLAAAAKSLADAAASAAAAAQTPGLSAAAAQAVQTAQAAIAKGQAMAAQQNRAGTQAQESAAQQALAAAQAAVAMSEAGMMASSSPGPGPEPGQDDGSPQPGPPGTPGDEAATSVTGGSTEAGKLHDASGHGKFVALEARDRAAIDQTQAEKRPQEYAGMIDQYMKNLADQSSSAP